LRKWKVWFEAQAAVTTPPSHPALDRNEGATHEIITAKMKFVLELS